MKFFRTKLTRPTISSALERLLRSAIHAFEAELFQSITDLLNTEAKTSIDKLLIVEEAAPIKESDPEKHDFIVDDDEELGLSHLKGDAGRIGLGSVLQELASIGSIKSSTKLALFPKTGSRKKCAMICVACVGKTVSCSYWRKLPLMNLKASFRMCYIR